MAFTPEDKARLEVLNAQKERNTTKKLINRLETMSFEHFHISQ